MTDRQTNKSGVEVDELVAINILYDASMAALSGEWIESD